MRSLAQGFALLLPLLAAACGGGTDQDEDDVIAAVRGANKAFVAGRYAESCAHYTVSVRSAIARLSRQKSCEEGWSEIAMRLRRGYSEVQIEAMAEYVPESAEVDGDSATAHYGEPPGDLPRELAALPGSAINLLREGDRWLIASIPGDTDQSVSEIKLEVDPELEPGRQVAAAVGCLACHLFGESGNPAPGPDLTHIGNEMTGRQIARAVRRGPGVMPSYEQLARREPQRFEELISFLASLE